MAFNGKLALIVGGGSGIGQLAARNLAQEGKIVAAVDVNEEGLKATADGFDNIHTWIMDVTDAPGVASTIDQVEAKLGPIDRVYNAAAIMPLGKLLEQDLDVIKKIMRINYEGLVTVTQALLPRMIDRGSGDFINFASMAGWVPTSLMGAYNASKFAVVAFNEVLYHENMNTGVKIICVCPPAVQTPLLQQGKDTAWPKFLDVAGFIQPQEVLDGIEVSLDRGEFWCFPGKTTKLGWRMRRWFPGLIWSQVHKAEGW